MQNEELIVAHRQHARAIALSRRCFVNQSELDDMISEAQLALVLAGRRFDGRGSFAAWIGKRVAGALDDWSTSKKRRYGMSAQGRGNDGAAVFTGNPFVELGILETAAVQYLVIERRVLLEAALTALPPRLAVVLRQRFWLGETMEDIARRLGVTQSYVSQLAKLGLALLRKELALRGVQKLGDLL